MKAIFLCFLLISSIVLGNDKPYIFYGGHRAGMFSEFLVILGILEKYDNGTYAGVEVSLGNGELYFDAKHGPNWWEYYFSPIKTERPLSIKLSFLSSSMWAQTVTLGHSALSRKRCNDLIKNILK